MDLTTFIDSKVPLFVLAGYPASGIEIVAVIFGLWSIWLTAKEHVICWPTGIVNCVLFFAIFHQVQLYSDMLLQIYFIAMSIYGWWRWLHPASAAEANARGELRTSYLPMSGRLLTLCGIAVGTASWGLLVSRLHLLWPALFPLPAAYPYSDGSVAVLSVIATYLMARKHVECWLLWITADVLCVGLYFLKSINLIAIEYAVYLVVCLCGLAFWLRTAKETTRCVD